MTNTIDTSAKPLQNSADMLASKDVAALTELDSASDKLIPQANNDDWSGLTKDLVDTLPRVWARGLLYFLIVMATIILPWSMLSKVDETGTARGRLEPQGKTQKIDSPITGTVEMVKVKEGQWVKAGQPLVKLDSKILRTELQQAKAKLEGQLNRIAQLNVVQNQLKIAVRTQQLQGQAQSTEQMAQLSQIQQRLAANKKLDALERERLEMATQDFRRHHTLLKQGAIAKKDVEEVESNMLERNGLFQQAQANIQEATTELEKQQSAYKGIQRQGELALLDSQRQLKDIQSQIMDARAESVQTQKLIQSLKLQLQQRTLRSPVDGRIFQLALENVGAVLDPGQTIAHIAPKGTKLIFRAKMPSQESGFLKEGMPVKLKFDAYPFQDYGIVAGQLKWISPDSKVQETVQGTTEFFELDIEVDQLSIQTPNKRVALTSGQTGIAEVITRQRRIIDFLIDPFKKLNKGGVEL